MASYKLKVYRRENPNSWPGKLIGEFGLDAADPDEAASRASQEFADTLAQADYAFIAGEHGRIVWERGGRG
jgi:hypothetical protein